MKKERHYKVQKHERSCALCVHNDVIVEPYNNPNGDKMDICALDHEQVEASGICDNYERQKRGQGK